MSEKNTGSHEFKALDSIEHSNEHIKKHTEHQAESAEKEQPSIEHLTKEVEQQSISKEDFSYLEHESPKKHPILHGLREKEMAWSRIMTRTRKKLPFGSRSFSKVVHIPVIDRTSEVIGKTVARPNGMLWGAVFAFVGSSALLWVSKRYGYEYNYLAATILFISGLIIGTLAELIWNSVRRKKHQ